MHITVLGNAHWEQVIPSIVQPIVVSVMDDREEEALRRHAGVLMGARAPWAIRLGTVAQVWLSLSRVLAGDDEGAAHESSVLVRDVKAWTAARRQSPGKERP